MISRFLFCRGRLSNVRVSQLFCLLDIMFLLLSRRRRGFFSSPYWFWDQILVNNALEILRWVKDWRFCRPLIFSHKIGQVSLALCLIEFADGIPFVNLGPSSINCSSL